VKFSSKSLIVYKGIGNFGFKTEQRKFSNVDSWCPLKVYGSTDTELGIGICSTKSLKISYSSGLTIFTGSITVALNASSIFKSVHLIRRSHLYILPLNLIIAFAVNTFHSIQMFSCATICV
jgi:hypothetical protein